MKRDGFLKTFEDMGGTVMANACGPCIGQWKREDVKKGEPNSIISSFNRNFKARNDANPETLSFLSSPELVTAMAFSGDLYFNPLSDSLEAADGTKINFEPPQADELPADGFAGGAEGFIAPAEDGEGVEVIVGAESERLQLLEPFPVWDGNDLENLAVLLKVEGKCTTDHISPAGPWLRYRGHLDRISDNMFLGANNIFAETGKANDVLSKESNLTPSQVARRYKLKGVSSIVVGDENYGEGSSREHAAMSPRFLGVKVVIVKGFARIHESNLKKQGVLPLTFANPSDWGKIGQDDRVSVVGLSNLAPELPIELVIHKAGGEEIRIQAKHSMTAPQITWFKAGSALNALTA